MNDKTTGRYMYSQNDIADMTLSSDYKIRFKGEYLELQNRINKLYTMLVKYQADELDYIPDTPINVLQEQFNAMQKYKYWLDVRCKIEHINIY